MGWRWRAVGVWGVDCVDEEFAGRGGRVERR